MSRFAAFFVDGHLDVNYNLNASGMRKSKQEAAQTREHIVAAAALQFRQNGIAETGLAEVMASAGLTNGGFYRHFESKDQLVAEACENAFSTLLEKLEQRIAGQTPKKALRTLVTLYLSPERLNDFNNACPLAALGSDLRRAGETSRQIAAAGFERFAALIERQLTHLRPRQARERATAIVSAMVGSMILAGIAKDPGVSHGILKSTTDFILLDSQTKHSGDLS